jgi:signal transduction histidine kinase
MREDRASCSSRTREPSRAVVQVVILEVEDSGKGISLELQKRLFDPFYSTKPSGTGLGLSIAALIIEQHGGESRYKTEAGRSTTFGVLQPIAWQVDLKNERK